MLVAATIGAAALTVGAPAASAKPPCWRQILNEWTDNRQVSSTYPLHCYSEAIAHVPEDLLQYTDIELDVNAAKQQAARGVRTIQSTGGSSQPERQKDPDAGLFTQGFDKLGPNNADSMPLPLIILGAMALLLVALGAAGLAARRLRARKVPG